MTPPMVHSETLQDTLGEVLDDMVENLVGIGADCPNNPWVQWDVKKGCQLLMNTVGTDVPQHLKQKQGSKKQR